ncbi:MAG: type VI secretion system tube protein Hcp [Myxococcales bacterium]|nr:MAG: type VI secretion system tube protein Hcp [Myxococcales bacterium]
MAVDMFLRIDGINGESKDAKHADQIQVLSWSWNVSQTGTAGTGGGLTAGKVEHHDIEIRKLVDKASPVLYKLCCSGAHIASADLYVRKAAGGNDALEYLVIHFDDLIITSFDLGGQPKADQIDETVRINYSKVTIKYTPQDNKGQGQPPIEGGWDLQANQALA